jgi:cyclin-dependent kinase
LGTPNEEVWPGVSQLPDYKPTFPQWSAVDLARAVPSLDAHGIDLLRVSCDNNDYTQADRVPWLQQTLIYDPSHRLSGKSLILWQGFSLKPLRP